MYDFAVVFILYYIPYSVFQSSLLQRMASHVDTILYLGIGVTVFYALLSWVWCASVVWLRCAKIKTNVMPIQFENLAPDAPPSTPTPSSEQRPSLQAASALQPARDWATVRPQRARSIPTGMQQITTVDVHESMPLLSARSTFRDIPL